MRIFHVVESLYKHSGVNIACYDIATREAEQKHEVAVFSTISKSYKKEDIIEIPKNITTYVLTRKHIYGTRLSYIANLKSSMYQAIDEFKPDLIHIHAIWDPCVHTAISYAYKKKIKMILSVHGMFAPWALANSKWKKQLVWNLYLKKDLSRIDAFHVTCYEEKKYVEKLGFRQTVFIIPLGIDVPEDTPEFKRNSKSILFLSRIHPVKGVINLVRAWATIEHCGWTITVCGPDDGNHKKEVLEEIKRLNVCDSFFIKDAVVGKEKEDLFNTCELFVLPTFSENFGIVVLEALSYGVPVITTKGAPWQCLEDFHAGYWIEIGVQPLQKALSEFISLGETEKVKMSKNARWLAQNKFSWKVVIKKMLESYLVL